MSSPMIVKRYRQYEVQADGTEKSVNKKKDVYDKLLQEALDKAAQIEQEAEEKARLIAEDALAEAEAAREAAFASGREEGYKEGYQCGMAEAAAAVQEVAADKIREVDELAECIAAERHEALAREEKELALIAIEAAKKILRREVQLDEEAFPHMIEAIAAENEGTLRLFISEYQTTLEFRLDREVIKRVQNAVSGLKTVFVQENDVVMLETEKGVVDAGIDAQLDILRQEVERTASLG